MIKEDRKDIVVKGLFLGLILFASTLIYLLALQDMHRLQTVGTYLLPIAVGYGVLGFMLPALLYISTLRKNHSPVFSGAASLYMIGMLLTLVMVLAAFIPYTFRDIISLNAAVILIVWILDYLYLKHIAKELNSSLGYYNRVLIEDLNSKPLNEDSFIEEVQAYCRKNHLTLDILEYGIPAKVKMNNTLYEVRLGQYYSIVGTVVYTLEFRNLPKKDTTK